MNTAPVKNLFVGLLMGIISFLPGASGATIAVIFGIYERIVADIADIRNKLLKDLRFVIVVGVGFLVGIVVCAKVLKVGLADYEVPMMFFFAGLILIQIPDIKKMGDDGKPLMARDIICFVVGVAIMLLFLFLGLSTGNSDNSGAGFVPMFLAGIVYAMSMLSPGISGSTVLLALGLFTAFDAAIANLDFGLLLPIGLGLIVGVLCFAKVIEFCMERFRKCTYAVILGLTVGSIITVLYKAFNGIGGADTKMILLSCAGAVLGLVFGYALLRAARAYTASSSEE